MSEDVKIVQFGSLPEYQLPDWATEKTLDKIRDSMEKDLDLTEDTKRVLNNIFSEIKKTKSISSQQLKQMSSASGTGGGFDKASKGLDELTSSTRTARGATDEFRTEALEASRKLNYFGTQAMLTTKVAIIPMFYAIQRQLRKMLSGYTDTIGTFRALHQVGIVYQGTFIQFHRQIANLGMKHEEFGEMISKNSKVLSAISVPRFLQLSMTVGSLNRQLGETRFDLAQYGLTQSEAAKYNIEHLEKQRLMGVLQRHDENRLRIGMQEQIKSMTAYTKLMNKSKDEIIAGQQQLLGRADLVRSLQELPEHIREHVAHSVNEMTGVLSAFGHDELSDMLVDMIASPFSQASRSFQKLAEAGQADLAMNLARIADQTRSGQIRTGGEAIQQLTSILPGLERASSQGIQRMLSLNDETRDLANMFGGPVTRDLKFMQDNIARFYDESGNINFEALATAINNEQKTMTVLQDRRNKLESELAFAPLKMISDLFGDKEGGLSHITMKLVDVFEFATQKIQQIFGVDPKTMGMKEMSGTAKFGVGVAAAGGLLATGGAIGMLSKVATGMLQRAIGTAPNLPGKQITGKSMVTPKPKSIGGPLALLGMGAQGLTSLLAGGAGSESQADSIRAFGGVASSGLYGAAMGGAVGGPIGAIIGGLLGTGTGLYQGFSGKGKVHQPGEIPTGVDRAQERYLEDAQQSQINTERNAEESKNQLVAINRNIERLASEVATIKSLYRAEVASGGGLARTQG